MNLFHNQNFKYLLSLTLAISLFAVLAKFDGTVTVHITPLGLQLQLNNHSSKCLINPENIQPEPFDQELA